VKEKVLRQESVDMMTSNQTGTLFMKTMKTTSAAISNDVNFFPETEKPWGFGFMINTSDAVNGRPAKSAGWAGLFNSFFWLDKKNNLAGLIMMQMLPFLEDGAQKTLRDFEQSVYEA
jgi:methyl acetate hydrolase